MYKPRYLIMVTPNNNNKFYKQIPVDDKTWVAEYGRIGSTSTKKTYSMSVWDSKYNEKLRDSGYQTRHFHRRTGRHFRSGVRTGSFNHSSYSYGGSGRYGGGGGGGH